MEVFRLSKKAYANLSGRGSALKGGRWNSVGVEVIYTSANRALAATELLVHLTSIPANYVILQIFVPDTISLMRINIPALPSSWLDFPPTPQTQIFGNNFVAENKHCVLQVPSAVVPGELTIY